MYDYLVTADTEEMRGEAAKPISPIPLRPQSAQSRALVNERRGTCTVVRNKVADEDEPGPIGGSGHRPIWRGPFLFGRSSLPPPLFLFVNGEGGLGEESPASGARSTAMGSRMLPTNAGGHGTTSDRPSALFLFSFLTDDHHPPSRPLCDLTISIAPVRQTEVLPVA